MHLEILKLSDCVSCLLRIPNVVLLFSVLAPYCIAQSSGERDTDFKVVLERRIEKPAGFQANIATTSTYPCEGYSLRTRVRWDKDTVSIYVLGLVRPSPCVQSSAEATGTVLIGELKEGVSFVRILYRGDFDLHKVIRSKGRLRTIPIRRTFTDLRAG
jgi:hypothetical protein